MKPGRYCPIAACGALEDPSAAPYHLRWLIIDANGKLVTQKHHPRLAEVAVAVSFGYLAIRGPGMLRMDIPLDVIEDDDSVVRKAAIGTRQVNVVDEGDLAAAWISNFLGVPSRLVKVHPDESTVIWPEL